MSEASGPTEDKPSPVIILLFDALPAFDGPRLATAIRGIEPLRDEVQVQLKGECESGFVADLSFDDHKIQLVGLSAPAMKETMEQTISCSRFKTELTATMTRHRTQVICYYQGANSDKAEQLVALHKVAQGFLGSGVLGMLDPEAWNCMPRIVLEQITPEMLRASIEGEPLMFWIGFVKFLKDKSAVWFCTKGQHRFGLMDFACLNPLNQGQATYELFNRLFCFLRKWKVTPQPGDTAQIGPNEYVLFREPYEFQDWLNGPAGTLVVERISEADARTGGPNGSGKLIQMHDRPVLLDPNDPAIATATAFARESLPHFWKVFERPEQAESGFALKAGLSDSQNCEFFWLGKIERNEGVLWGTIDNSPGLVTHVKEGDRVAFSEADITDWLYTRSGKTVGNFTMRAMVKNLSPEEARMYLQNASDFLPLKVQCQCGQRFAFEVEAVNGRMPSPVKCPACGVDATSAANEMIARAFSLPAGPPPVASLRTSVPPPIQSAPPPLQQAPPRQAAPPPRPPAAPSGPAVKRTLCQAAALALLCGLLIIPLGFVSIWIHFPVSWLAAIPGIFIGHSAISTIRSDRRQKGMVLAIIGLVLCYLHVGFVGLGVVRHYAGGNSRYSLFQRRQARVEVAPMTPQPAPRPTPFANNRNPNMPARPMGQAEPRVVTNPLQVEIPDAPLSGTLGGQGFVCDQAVLRNGFLKLSQGSGLIPPFSVSFHIDLKRGESIAGKRVVVASQATVPMPITLTWPADGHPNHETLMRNYVMRLEFGEPNGGRIPGRIYLEASPVRQTKIAGVFEVELK